MSRAFPEELDVTSTCSAGDSSGLRMSVNGEQKGMLKTSPGSRESFAGTSGSNNVIVAVKFSNSTGSVVYGNAAL